MTRILILTIAFCLIPNARADTDAEKFFRDGALENMKILAKEKDPRERVKAADSLAGTKYPDAIVALGAALTDADVRVRAAAADALWKSEKAAEPVRANLLKALDDSSPEVAVRAAGALQSQGMKEADLVATRKRVLAAADAPRNVRFLAARGLIGFEPPLSLLDPMLAYLDQSAAPRTTNTATDTARRNTELCAQALARLVKTGDRALIAPLQDELRRTRHSQVVLLKTLALFNPKPDGWTETLLGFLGSPERTVRIETLKLLGDIKTERDIQLWLPRVAAMLRDAEASVRAEAMWTLGNTGGLAAAHIDAVISALGDPEASVRKHAVRAIGEMGAKNQAVSAAAKSTVAERARPALTKVTEMDGDLDVRAAAKSALAKLDGGAGTAAAPVDSGIEAGGLAVLRQHGITFEEGSFFRALTELDLVVIRAFLDAGMSPSASVAGVGPPLRAALFAGRACSPAERPTRTETKAMVRLLLDRGADANQADARGNTVLMEAASKGCDRDVIKILIGGGAKVGAVNAAGLSAFEMGLYAAHDGLEELIAAGYRLPPEKVKSTEQAYAGKPASLALIRKAIRR